jgi:hypothetical protein
MTLLICLLMSATVPSGDAMWLDADRFDAVHVVLATEATDVERQGAHLFVETWKACTGFDVPVSSAPTDSVNVWIGAGHLPKALADGLDMDSLGFDGVRLKSYANGTQRDLVLAGPKGKGTLYAVYEFFEQAFDVRWLTAEARDIPPAPSALTAIDVAHTPPFAHRDMILESKYDALRLNSPFVWGNGIHSFYHLLPPEEYFDAHPEYYSEINGTRIAPKDLPWRKPMEAGNHPDLFGQLCMSNPAVTEAIAQRIEEMIAENPEANLFSVSQNDWGNNCQCTECKALDEAEGSPIGSVLTGVNRIADLVGAKHPGVFIHTFAYTYTRKAPKNLRPRENVIVQLCTFECDFARPLDQQGSPVNHLFYRDLQDWAKLTDKLIIWDYPINYWRFHLPHPMFHVYGPNIRAFAANSVIGVFEQMYLEREVDFGYLKAYMLAKLMWDPQRDPVAVRDEFLERYYGPAAPHMKTFIAQCEGALREADIDLNLYDRAPWIDASFVEEADATFKEALALTEGTPYHERVELVRLQVEMASLACRPELEFSEQSVTIRKPAIVTAEEHAANAKRLGVQYLGEWQDPIELAIEQYGGAAAVSERTVDLVVLENERYLVWVIPAIQGSIVRFRDKSNDIEMLRGFEAFGGYPGLWQDWVDRNTLGEVPCAEEYRIVSNNDREAILEATVDTGLVVRRHMRLTDDAFEVTLELHNPTEAPVDAKVKLHPEFYSQLANVVPEVWLDAGDTWEQLNANAGSDDIVGHQFLEPRGPGRWGFFVPQAKAGLVSTFVPEEIDRLFYYHNTGKLSRQVNLELLPRRELLEPGATRTLQATYRIVTQRPSAL